MATSNSPKTVAEKLESVILHSTLPEVEVFLVKNRQQIIDAQPWTNMFKHWASMRKEVQVMLSSLFSLKTCVKISKVKNFSFYFSLIVFMMLLGKNQATSVNIQEDNDYIQVISPVSKQNVYSLVESHNLTGLSELWTNIQDLQNDVLKYMSYNETNRFCSTYVNDDFPDEFLVVKGQSNGNNVPLVFSHVEQNSLQLYQAYFQNGQCKYRFSQTFAESIGTTNNYGYGQYKDAYKFFVMYQYNTFPKNCMIQGYITVQKPYKIEKFRITNIIGCKTLCNSEPQCNTIQWNHLTKECRLYDTGMIKVTRTAHTTDYYTSLAMVVMTQDCQFIRTMDTIPMVKVDGKLELMKDHCTFEDSFYNDKFQFRCGPFYTTKFKSLQSMQDKLKDFHHILIQNYKINSGTSSDPQQREKRGVGAVVGLIFSIATKIGKHWNKIVQISDLISRDGPWTLLRLKNLILSQGYKTSLSSDLTYFPLLFLDKPPTLSFKNFHQELKQFEFDFHSIQKQVEDVIRYYRSIIDYNQPLKVKLNTTDFLYSRYTTENEISRTFIFSNDSDSYQKMIMKVPLGNDFYDLSAWTDNLDILNISSSCSDYNKMKRSIDSYNCKRNAILKNRLSDNLVTIRLFDKIFNGFVIAINQKSLIQFICKDNVVTYNNDGFGLYVCGLNCDVFVFNDKIITALQFTSVLKPKQLYSGPLIKLNKLTKALDIIFNWNIQNWNDILQYILLLLLGISVIYTNCQSLHCTSVQEREGVQTYEVNQENQNLLPDQNQEMQLIRNVSNANPI